ncbi:unnamed protein product [Plutella xylostella]|uniref:(diamondback moth) hypothetical protein n=1 Tax=Plutella xylostella TaxID=51655 RepID=A0A8S4D7G8_PLUXY|nr:unnamed protein product [Plutella xylostella]
MLASRLPLRKKLRIFKTYMRFRITYAAPAWYALCSMTNCMKLQLQQNLTLRAVRGCMNLTECVSNHKILLRERLPVIPGQLFLHNTQFGYIVAGTAPLNSEGCSSLPSNFCKSVSEAVSTESLNRKIDSFWECEQECLVAWGIYNDREAVLTILILILRPLEGNNLGFVECICVDKNVAEGRCVFGDCIVRYLHRCFKLGNPGIHAGRPAPLVFSGVVCVVPRLVSHTPGALVAAV